MENRYSIDNRYGQDITIPCYDADASFHLKPSAFMDHAQELAYWAAQKLNFGYDDLQKHQTAWVLSRMHIKFQSLPRWRDETTLYTWHKGLDGLFFLRDFELRAAGDTDFHDKSKVLAACTSSWIVMNMETRRLVRSEEVLDMVPATTQCNDDAIADRCAKVTIPGNLSAEVVGERKVSYSDVDIIGHTNNARYLIWAMDCLDYDEAACGPVKEIFISFNKETKPGETISLLKACDSSGSSKSFFIEGKSEGKNCFCIQIVY